MGSGNRMLERVAVIDVGVTVLGEVSQFWDNASTVSSMLIAEFASSPLRIADHETVDAPQAADLTKISAPLNSTLTGELDGAQWYLGLTGEEILLAALGLAIARTIGEGVVPVDVAGHSGSVAAVVHVCGSGHRHRGARRRAPPAFRRVRPRRSSPHSRRRRSSSPTSAPSPALRHRAGASGVSGRRPRAAGLVVRHPQLRRLHRRGARRAVPAGADRADVGGRAAARQPRIGGRLD